MEKDHFCKECCDFKNGVEEKDLEFNDICFKKCNNELNPPKGVNTNQGLISLHVESK